MKDSTRIVGLLIGLALVVALAVCCLGRKMSAPIAITDRVSTQGGRVIQVTNTSDGHIHAVDVSIKASSGEPRKYQIVTIDPHGTIEIGWLELDGWDIPPGTKVHVKCDGYMFGERFTAGGN